MAIGSWREAPTRAPSAKRKPETPPGSPLDTITPEQLEQLKAGTKNIQTMVEGFPSGDGTGMISSVKDWWGNKIQAKIKATVEAQKQVKIQAKVK